MIKLFFISQLIGFPVLNLKVSKHLKRSFLFRCPNFDVWINGSWQIYLNPSGICFFFLFTCDARKVQFSLHKFFMLQDLDRCVCCASCTCWCWLLPHCCPETEVFFPRLTLWSRRAAMLVIQTSHSQPEPARIRTHACTSLVCDVTQWQVPPWVQQNFRRWKRVWLHARQFVCRVYTQLDNRWRVTRQLGEQWAFGGASDVTQS